MKNKLYILIVVMLYLLMQTGQFVYAQTYPVQAVPTVVSPYSSKLSDYSNAMANRINLQLITTDLLVQNRPAQLHLKIQGNGITAQSAGVLSGIPPIYLNGGEILSLTSADLAGYFRYQNLQGLTTTQYSEALPDGVYTICFQVYDLVTKKWLSQNSCTTVYLMLNDPPQLNLPSNYEQIPSSDFPNIIFSWTPRHLNATNVSYDFELKEILNPNLDPAFAYETSPLLHKEQGVRTTTLLYDITKPTLVPGKRYAWRVKAISTTGLSENSVFKNNGYSQIYSFTYNSNCTAPRYLLSEQQSASRVKVMWQGENSHQKYHVQYRKKDVENAEWFEVYTVNTQTLLQGLEPGFTYEFRVGATCEPEQYGITQSYVYSGIQTFTINEDENSTAYNCGIIPSIEVTNQQPLGAMVVNETFMAGDFPVKVLEVTGANGVFTGSGYIQVPYLFDTRIGVEFNNVRINSDYQLIEGMVETTYDPDWSNVDYVDDLFDVNQQTVTVNFPIDTIVVKNGEIVVTGPNGQTETFPGGKDTVITDSNGNSYYVDADGNVSGPHKQADGGKPTPENTYGVDKNGEVTALTAEGIKVTFEKINNETQYAFDQVTYNKSLTKEYKEVSGAFVPFKAVPNGATDKLLAKVTLTGTNVVADSLFFKTQNGVKIDAVKEGEHFVLTLKGAQKFAVEEVQATIKQGDKYKIAGVFNLVHVSPKSVKLKLVPTSSTINVSDKITEIKTIYRQLAVDVEIEVEQPFDITNYLVNGKLPTEDAFGDLSTYSTAQNAIIDAFKNDPQRTVDEAYYLFVTDATSSNGQGGYMRLNNQFGFVFANSARTISHELGHGAFRLEHPFKQYKSKGLNQNDTQGLMDYAGGTELLFTDWKQINDPAFKLYAFQGQSDGEDIDKKFVLEEDGYFITPSNKLIKLVKGTEVSFYCEPPQRYQNNVLHGFKTPDGFYWDNSTQYQLHESFDGFYKVKNDKSDWEYDESGNRILYEDTNYNYNGAGQYPVYYILWVNLENGKSEYRIQKGEIDITNSQISSNKYFGGSITNVSGESNLPQVDVIKSTSCVQTVLDKGNLVDTIQNANYEIKIYSKDGKYTVEFAFKKEGNTKTKDQKEEIERQVEALMIEKLNQLGGLVGEPEKGFKEQTEDGGEFYVQDMNGREWMQTIGDLGESVWENAALPKNYWNKDEGYNDATIHVPPTFAGVSDGVIEEVTSYPQLVKLGYDVSTKKEVRDALWESVKGISVETIKDAAVDFYEEKKANYTSDKTYIVQHTVSKDAVQVASMMMGGGIVGGLKKGVKDVDDAVGKAGKEVLSEIGGELGDGADKLANKLVKEGIEKGDFEKEIVESSKNEIKDISTKKGRKLSWEEVQKFFKRGNEFNAKGRLEYGNQFSEIHLATKKRLDTYIPGEKIISRKATDLDNITEQTWKNYCNELVTKYKVGTPVNSTKLPNEPPLSGKYYLEIPSTNLSSTNLEKFKNIAKEYGKENGGIHIIFLNE